MTTLDIDDIRDKPGLRRALERNQVDFGSNGSGNGNAWRKHVSLDRVLLLTVVLFNAGTFWERQQNTNASLATRVGVVEVRLTAAEELAISEQAQTSATFVRRDVLDERMKSMEQRLANIEAALRIGQAR